MSLGGALEDKRDEVLTQAREQSLQRQLTTELAEGIDCQRLSEQWFRLFTMYCGNQFKSELVQH